MAKFEKGISGNSKGKPRGALSPSGRLRESIAKDLPGILATLCQRALEGDVQAAALLLSRALPPLRPETAAQVLPVAGNGLAERAEAVIAGALSGELPPNTAGELLAALSQQGRILETAELMQRIERLENALAATKENEK